MTRANLLRAKVCALAARKATRPENAAALAGAAVHMATCGTGTPERVAFAASGGRARAEQLSPARRAEIARMGGKAKRKKPTPLDFVFAPQVSRRTEINVNMTAKELAEEMRKGRKPA